LSGVEFKNRGGMTLFNDTPITQIGRGSFGNIFQDENGLIYKETQLEIYEDDNLEKECEQFYRNFLLEVFIQVVLQNKNPGAVGKIHRIYIDNRINKRHSKRPPIPIHPRLPTEKNTPMIYSFFITMDEIPYRFDTYARNTKNPSRTSPNKISLIEAKRIFIKLAENLKDFESVGFKHGDLHMGNIMFNYEGDPIIIDLGMACLEVGGHVYSVKKNECQSYDLAILMASLYEPPRDVFEANAYQAIGDCMKTDNGSIYDIARRMDYNSVFHAFYYDKLKKNTSLASRIPTRLTDIDEFIQYWTERCNTPSSCTVMGGGGKTRSRKSKNRKSRKSRKAPQIR
jgi:serine/threonine protein kinase